jgi:hypothetical protein
MQIQILIAMQIEIKMTMKCQVRERWRCGESGVGGFWGLNSASASAKEHAESRGCR